MQKFFLSKDTEEPAQDNKNPLRLHMSDGEETYLRTEFYFNDKYQGRIQGGGPLKLEKNMIFWRKIVIFHTKYPNNFRASLRSAQFF